MAFDASGNWKPENLSVATRVSEITAKDSPIMTLARGAAMKTANRRGMLNSTMAARAGEQAVLDHALPMASQDVQQSYGKDLQYMQGKQQADLQASGADAAARERISAALVQIAQTNADGIAQIYSNKDLSASARSDALVNMRNQTQASINMIQQIYGVQLEWSPTATGNGTAAPIGGGATIGGY